MCTANRAQHVPLCLSLVLLASLCLLNACAGGPTSPTHTATSTSTPLPASPVPTFALPAVGVAAIIPVGSAPEITVESGSAKQLTFIGSDTRSISTNLYALPYKKDGNRVYITFSQPLSQALEIHIPRAATLTVTLTEGNVTVDALQGPLNITLTSGTIHLKNFTPRGKDTIQTGSGLIDVTFAKDAACNLKAQTNFGTIVSGYATISMQRDGEKAQAAGIIKNGSGASVNLIVGAGTITLGPA